MIYYANSLHTQTALENTEESSMNKAEIASITLHFNPWKNLNQRTPIFIFHNMLKAAFV